MNAQWIADADEPPLSGLTVVDVSRMLPGAVLARTLIDLGARVIKVEDPRGGDPMRNSPPIVDGIGAGFTTFYRGAQSLRLDLREERGRSVLAQLLARADIFVESFRSGTLHAWGLSLDDLEAANPRLVSCSLPGHTDERLGHDLNFIAESGLLARLHRDADAVDVPPVQLADVSSALLAATAITAALVQRGRTGRGRRIRQPLVTGTLPLLMWPWADSEAGQSGISGTLLGGDAPSYRCYRCADARWIAVGCLEPKFWIALCGHLGVPKLAVAGLDTGDKGQAAGERVAEIFASQPRRHWLALLGEELPVSPVDDLDEVRRTGSMDAAGLTEQTPLRDGANTRGLGPAIPSLGRTPDSPAPRLGEHDRSLADEFGFEPVNRRT